MPTIRANGIDIYYEAQGAGDPLLLIAGFGCDHTIWTLVVPALAQKYRVIVFDNRGIGRSSGPDTITSIRQMADDAAALLDAIGLGAVHVAGHSMGGMIAQELTLAHRDKVRSLMLLSSSAKSDERGKAIIDGWGELPRLVDPVTATRLILPWIYTSAFFAKVGAIEQVIKQISANPFPPSVDVISGQSRAVCAHDVTDRIGDLDCPTLVLVGKKDILTPVKSSEHLVRHIRGAELVVLDGTGHGLLIESPAPVAKSLLAFLSRQRSISTRPMS